MKTIQLLSALKSKERKLLLSVRKIKRSETLSAMIKYLFKRIDKGEEYNKEAMHLAVYKKPFQPDDTQKLRRDQHTINKEVEGILIHDQLERRLDSDPAMSSYLLTMALFDRDQMDLGSLELEHLTNLSRENYLVQKSFFNRISLIYQIRLGHLYRSPITAERIETTLEILEEWKNVESLAAMRTITNINASIALEKGLLHGQFSSGKGVNLANIPSTTWDIILKHYKEDNVVQYEQYRYQAYTGNSEESLAARQAIVSLHEDDTAWTGQNIFSVVHDVHSLAVAYHYNGQMENAETYFLKAIQAREQFEGQVDAKTNQWDIVYESYTKFLLLNGRYEEGTACYENNRHRFRDERGTIDIRTHAACCYVMLEAAANAKELIFANSRYTDNKKITDKQLLAMCFYLEGNYELMERELDNIQQMLRFREHDHHEMHKHNTRLLQLFIRAIQSADDEKERQLESLRNELVRNEANKNPDDLRFFFTPVWLKLQLGIND